MKPLKRVLLYCADPTGAGILRFVLQTRYLFLRVDLVESPKTMLAALVQDEYDAIALRLTDSETDGAALDLVASLPEGSIVKLFVNTPVSVAVEAVRNACVRRPGPGGYGLLSLRTIGSAA